MAAKCWVCRITLDEAIAAGMRSTGENTKAVIGICKECNRILSSVRQLTKLSEGDLLAREIKTKRMSVIHNVVRDHRNTMKVGEMTKEVLRRLQNGF